MSDTPTYLEVLPSSTTTRVGACLIRKSSTRSTCSFARSFSYLTPALSRKDILSFKSSNNTFEANTEYLDENVSVEVAGSNYNVHRGSVLRVDDIKVLYE